MASETRSRRDAHSGNADGQSHTGLGHFERADAEARVVVTKDADFVHSFQLRGQPGKLLLISTGNISNDDLLKLWKSHMPSLTKAMESARFSELTTTTVVVHA